MEEILTKLKQMSLAELEFVNYQTFKIIKEIKERNK